MKTLNIIGCGHVGKTLAHLWQAQGVFRIGGILNQSPESAQQAVDFIGAGTAVKSISDLPDADITMIATPDSNIEAACQALCANKTDMNGHVVFHCSGALPSSILQSAKNKGAVITSVHPVKSFTCPANDAKTFEDTYCGIEGDKEALNSLEKAIETIGGTTFPINPDQKTLYHTGSVFICNYLTALMEAGLSCFEKAGVPRQMATNITAPIIAETIRNIQTKGTAHALTGPIARGDMDVYDRQLKALQSWDGDYAAIYEKLGKVAMELTQEQRMAA